MNQTIDEIFEKLDGVIAKMEEGTSLEESFALYQEGVKLVKACNEKIERIEKQVLLLDEEGNTYEF